jgi:hypothetical protein
VCRFHVNTTPFYVRTEHPSTGFGIYGGSGTNSSCILRKNCTYIERETKERERVRERQRHTEIHNFIIIFYRYKECIAYKNNNETYNMPYYNFIEMIHSHRLSLLSLAIFCVHSQLSAASDDRVCFRHEGWLMFSFMLMSKT